MSEKRPEGVLQNVITYICFKNIPLSESKLTKLIYLIDVYHYESFGETLTSVPFKHYYYGAWAPEISEELEKLGEAGIIKEEAVKTRKGRVASVPKPHVSSTTVTLPKTGAEAIENVLQQWGSSSTDDIVDYTKTTLPFLNTPFGESIDFKRTDPVTAYAADNRISEGEAAMLGVVSTPFLVEKALQGDEELRTGEGFMTREEVFGR